VFKTVDGGETWRAHNTGFQDGRITFSGLIVTALAIDPQTPTVLYAGTSPTGVFRSADGGRTWRATSFLRDVTRLVVDPSGTIGDVTALAIDPKTPATI